jgi:hypothetical protein
MKMVFSGNKKKSGQPNNLVNINETLPSVLSYNPTIFFQAKMLDKIINNSDCITCKNIK